MKKKRLLIYFCICLALLTLLGVSFFYLRKLNALEKNNERVDHSYQVILKTNLLEQNLLNAETSQRGYLLSGNSDFLEAYLYELKGIPRILSNLDQLTSDNAVQQQCLDTLRDAINSQLHILKENMVSPENDSISIADFHKGQLQMNRIREIIETIKTNETDLLSERSFDKSRNTTESKRSSYFTLLISFFLCCIASAVVIWFFNRNEKYGVELEDQLHKLTTLNSEIRELTIASAHNLQEPMRKVQMIIDWLQHQQELKDPNLTDSLNRIKDIYSRQQITNNKIIEYYHILLNAGSKSRINLNEFIEQLRLRHKWAGEFDLQVDRLPDILANHEQVELLFMHLIQNCIQFRDARRPLHIRIHAPEAQQDVASGKKYHTIIVSDNGLGVREEFHEKIFGLFQKIEFSPYNTVQSGMGLSFCRRILLNHGGFIQARKNGENGLKILLFFPKSQ